MSQPIRSWAAIFVFRPARKTNLVENVETLLPVKFRLLPLSGFRDEVSKIEKIPRGIQGEKSRKIYGKFGKTGLINWSISKSPKGERNQVSGSVSFPCHPVANASWKPLVIR